MANKVLKLLSRPFLVEQAGKSTIENTLIIIALSLAIVSTSVNYDKQSNLPNVILIHGLLPLDSTFGKNTTHTPT
jgi:threonine/homoserine efflux transporter RhtA